MPFAEPHNIKATQFVNLAQSVKNVKKCNICPKQNVRMVPQNTYFNVKCNTLTQSVNEL